MSRSTSKVRFGLELFQVGTSWDELLAYARLAERLGFDSLWAFDHLQGYPDPEVPIFEGWTALAALAGSTERIQIGHQVLCVGFRHPALLAKMSATLDHASNGRFVLGLGAGWNEAEFKGFGLPFPSIGTRLQQLEEALDLIRKLWTEQPVSYFGEQFQVEDAYCHPRPIQEPHPPILVGGSGEEVLLRIVAEHADIWNNPRAGHDLLPHKIDVLHRHCESVKRDPTRIEVSQQVAAAIGETETEARVAAERIRSEMALADEQGIVAGRPAQCVERLQKTVEMGATNLILRFGRRPSHEALELFAAEVMPHLR